MMFYDNGGYYKEAGALRFGGWGAGEGRRKKGTFFFFLTVLHFLLSFYLFATLFFAEFRLKFLKSIFVV